MVAIKSRRTRVVCTCAFRNCSATHSRFVYSVPRTVDAIHTNVHRRSVKCIHDAPALMHLLKSIVFHLLAFYRQSQAVSHRTCLTAINLIYILFFSLLLRPPGRMTTHSDTETKFTRVQHWHVPLEVVFVSAYTVHTPSVRANIGKIFPSKV